MDGTTQISVLKDESTHTSGRKSARSGRVEVLVRADRRRSWTAEQKRQIVAESLEPDVMPADVARRYGIGTGLLYTWRRQMVSLPCAVSVHSGPQFASVELSTAPPTASSVVSSVSEAVLPPLRPEGLIEIQLSGGVSLRVDACVDGRALRRVLAALEDR
jgi:transposase